MLSPQDMAVATMPGVVSVTGVDDRGGTMKVSPAEPRFERPDIVKAWTTKTAVLVHQRLVMDRIRLGLPLDERAKNRH